MDYNEKVQYLKSYRDKCDRITFIDNQIEGVQAIKYTPSINGPKKSLNAYIEEKSILESEIEHIKDCINSISNEKARWVLEYRFLEYIPLGEISDLMNYSHSQVYRYYKKGIEEIVI